MKTFQKISTLGLFTLAVASITVSLNKGLANNAIETSATTTRTLDIVYDLNQNQFNETHVIGNFQFGFNFTYNGATKQIFTNTGYYLNDHLNEALDVNGNPIDLGNGILVNGKPLVYWVNYSTTDTYSREKYVYTGSAKTNGVHESPLYHYGVYSPVLVYLGVNNIRFDVNLAYFSMDSIQITFVKDVFHGYFATSDYDYQLANNITFSSQPNTDGSVSLRKKIIFTTTPNETSFNGHILQVDETSKTGPNTGNPYKRYTVWTNIPRESSIMTDVYWADHHRYLFDNVTFMGKSLTAYNLWARGNAKDFSDVVNKVQNSGYETSHPAGSADPKYDLALSAWIATDQVNYVIFVNVPDTLVSDLSLGTIDKDTAFGIRTGSAWLSLNGSATTVARISHQGYGYDRVVNDFVDSKMHTEIPYSNNNDTGACKGDSGYYKNAKHALNQLTSNQVSIFRNNVDLAEPRARYEAWATACGDATPYDGNEYIQSARINSIGENVKTNSLVIIISVIVCSVSLLSFIVVVKKRKHY